MQIAPRKANFPNVNSICELMLAIYTYNQERRVHIYYNDEGKEELKNQLTYAKRDNDHAFFVLDAPPEDYEESNQYCTICDFINIIYSNMNDDFGSIENGVHGYSSVELLLSQKTFDLLLEIINSSNKKEKSKEISLKNTNIVIRLSYAQKC